MATIKTRIGPDDHGQPMTLDEFQDAEEQEGFRYELARGVLEVTQVPDDPHWQIVSNLHELIGNYRRAHPGLILRVGGAGECQVLIPQTASGRNPDLAVVLAGTPRDGRGRQPPGLVAEVVSRGGEERDYTTKREEYAAFGLREYWIVGPRLKQVTVLSRPTAVADWSERSFGGDQTIESPLLPGFAGAVADLWADAGLDEDGTD